MMALNCSQKEKKEGCTIWYMVLPFYDSIMVTYKKRSGKSWVIFNTDIEDNCLIHEPFQVFNLN